MLRRIALALLLASCSTAADGGADVTIGATQGESTDTSTAATTTAGSAATTDEPSVTTTTTAVPTTGPEPTTGEPAGPCGQPPPFTGAMAQTIEAAGMERDYDLVIPADYDPDTAYPLVFAWHGRGGCIGSA
ncbi:hypothetical protein [Nannocystis pusilla]|uniref:Uncharacterized protein n=1 Tax=Nannocystis pusilla TaxID=889268 RepID=A0ABS7TU16_9BACT|nr:hypothetical protein [Nannocystis pusilla]MBZ5711703.1 hypothetical protein [Nannocystis pusilla]